MNNWALLILIITLYFSQPSLGSWIVTYQDGQTEILTKEGIVSACDVYPANDQRDYKPSCFFKNTTSAAFTSPVCTNWYLSNQTVVDASLQLQSWMNFTADRLSECFCEARRYDCALFVNNDKSKRIVSFYQSSDVPPGFFKSQSFKVLTPSILSSATISEDKSVISVKMQDCVPQIQIVRAKRSGPIMSMSSETVPVECDSLTAKRGLFIGRAKIYLDQRDVEVRICSESVCPSVWRYTKGFRQALEEACLSGNCEACETIGYRGACLARFYGGWFLGLSIVLTIVVVLVTIVLTKWFLNCICWNSKKCCRRTTEVEMSLVQNESTNIAPSQSITINVPSNPLSGAPSGVFLAILLLSFSVGGLCCTSNIVSNSIVPHCIRYNSSSLVCKARPTLSFLQGGEGSKSCISIGFNGTEAVSFSLTTDFIRFRQEMYKSYWTTDWYPHAESRSLCPSDPGCENFGCSGYYQTGAVSNPFSFFSHLSVGNPGKTLCDGSVYTCGGPAVQECWLCGNRCIYGRATMVPGGEQWQINSPGIRSLETQISIKLGEEISTLSTLSNSMENDDYKVVMGGTFQDSSFSWNSKKFAVRGNSIYLVDAAEANLPLAGTIGDIQSDFDNFFASPLNSLIPASFYTYTASREGLAYHFSHPGIQALGSFPKFPMNYLGYSWTNEGTTLLGRVTEDWNSLITVAFKKNITFFVSDLAVCPEIRFGEMEGCFNCPYQTTFTLIGKSTCYPGTCRLSSDLTLSTNLISLGLEEFAFNISFYSSVPSVSSRIDLTCGEFKTSVNVTGILRDFSTIFQNNSNTPVVVTSGPISSGKFFGLPKIYDDLVLAVIIIAVFVVVGIIAFFIIRTIIRIKLGAAFSPLSHLMNMGKSQEYTKLPQEPLLEPRIPAPAM